jgi:hypothetical protein
MNWIGQIHAREEARHRRTPVGARTSTRCTARDTRRGNSGRFADPRTVVPRETLAQAAMRAPPALIGLVLISIL